MRSKNIISRISKRQIKNYSILFLAGMIFVAGVLLVWAVSLKIPTLESFSQRQVVESTKIYDRTGTVLLYDVNQNVKRTVVPYDQISQNVKNATIAIEDRSFYSHGGVDFTSLFRALIANIETLRFSQGGSTITQQVVKNSLLTNEKSISRKLKEWVLAIKLEKILTKDEILNLYLNEVAYGGAIYGVEEASQAFFGIHASELTVNQAAYLGALVQAPSYYSPYGPNRDKLESRKNLVLDEMYKNGYIKQDEHDNAKKEKITFKQLESKGIKAPHFVFYTISKLQEMYGDDMVQTGGLKVTTTLDWNIEQAGEKIADKYAASNKVNFNATNDAFVALDPKTGQVLAMIGSHNYFAKDIDGNFNIATAHRQPGSTFKPFVYAAAFNKGYTPNTVLFDVPTQFSTNCDVSNMTSTNGCYSPGNYDGQFRGPMTLRNALAQSINVPSVETLYLAGINNSITLAKQMGIQSLGDANQYGLTLVLGGGEVSLLDMTSSYGVFADEGTRHEYTTILKVEDKQGNTLQEFKNSEKTILPKNTALTISDILSDNEARTPAYGANSVLRFTDRSVAVKTGTTNDYKDAWIIGYTPSVVLGAWAGNNNNTPMSKKVAGLIVAPMWREFMDAIVSTLPAEQFEKPQIDDSFDLKPVLRGKWQGGESHLVDSVSGGSATEYTPNDSKVELLSGGIHSILYWLNKDDPRGPRPQNPNQDPQYSYWEYALTRWLNEKGIVQPTDPTLPQSIDTTHTIDSQPKVSVLSPNEGLELSGGTPITVTTSYVGKFPQKENNFYINGNFVGKSITPPFSFTFIPNDFSFITENNTLTVKAVDTSLQNSQMDVHFIITASQ